MISSPFKKYIDTSLLKLEKRLDDMATECQADETNVSHEMRQIMKATLTPDRQTVADSLIEFLGDKYDTKMWIVMVQEKSFWENSVLSGGFHHASVQNVVAYAISIDHRVLAMNFSELLNSIDLHLKPFVIPAWCSPERCWCYNSFEIADYLNRFLIPVRAKSEVKTEMLVFAEMGWQNLIIAISDEDQTTNPESIISTHSNETKDKCHHWAIVIPTKPAISFNPSPSPSRLRNQIECSYDLDRVAQEYGPLRNERARAYLSVQGDSKEEGVAIILDREWRNSSGQKWKLVDGQLRNGFGKCLTLRSSLNKFFGLFHYLYQYNCDLNQPEQKWDVEGLQITNDRTYCLGFPGKVHQETMFVRGVYFCDLSPSFIWYNWDTDCEDAMVIQSTTNGSRPLRNEFSRLVFDVYKDQYGIQEPWSNRPQQLWTFVDGGLLKNDDGKCLAGKGWYVHTVDCAADLIGNNGRWTYTENRQIKSDEGYCLTSPIVSSYNVFAGKRIAYLFYLGCVRDFPNQRWWYFL